MIVDELTVSDLREVASVARAFHIEQNPGLVVVIQKIQGFDAVELTVNLPRFSASDALDVATRKMSDPGLTARRILLHWAPNAVRFLMTLRKEADA